MTGVPSKKLPLSLQGQQLVWASSAQGGLQGVTELVRCERTQDVWLQDLQAELRVGHLSEDNHAFLHGRPTKVPGSWCARTQRPMCQENICYQLYKNASTATAILKYECPICHAERDTKRLVAVDADDPRCVEGFSMARGIFHTNGVKCHVNKLRAEQWARQRGQVIYYAVATDKVSSRALRPAEVLKCLTHMVQNYCGGPPAFPFIKVLQAISAWVDLMKHAQSTYLQFLPGDIPYNT